MILKSARKFLSSRPRFKGLLLGTWPFFIPIFRLRIRALSSSYNGYIARNILSKDPLFEVLSCKVEVRKYIAERVGADYSIPVIAVYSSAKELDISKFGREFVIKPSHASGMAIIVKENTLTNVAALKDIPSRAIITVTPTDFEKNIKIIEKKLNKWLETDYSYHPMKYPERVYARLRPKLIVETLLQLDGHSVPFDYKFHYFHGVLMFIQVDYDRLAGHKRLFFDVNWNELKSEVIFPAGNMKIEKPAKLEEMIQISRLLAKGLEAVRIDFMIQNQKVFVSEVSLFPDGGFGNFAPIYREIAQRAS